MTRLPSLCSCFGALLTASLGLAEARPAQEPETTVATDERKSEVIAGLRGLTIISTLTFDAAPGLLHDFETNYIFPARARWWHLCMTPRRIQSPANSDQGLLDRLFPDQS